MPSAPSVLNQVNIVAADLLRSAAFYRRLGVPFGKPVRNCRGKAYHASGDCGGAVALELDSPAFAPLWNKGWAGRADLAGRVVIGFGHPSRAAVDALYASLVAAGHPGLAPPHDAFWGARYTILEDPDGIAVGLMSPIDPARRTAPRHSDRARSKAPQRCLAS